MDKYCVYCHTNKVNGKKYIGITSQKPEKRWNNGHGYATNTYFYRAIKKYGWHNFQHEILYTELSKREAMSKEIELIAEYETCDVRYGYNQSKGGNLLTQNARKKISERMSGAGNPWYNKPKHQNNLKATRKAVCCVETDVVYESISQASRMTKINLGHIASACKGERKSAGGYHWKYVTVLKGGD